jgi:hypothetical protein
MKTRPASPPIMLVEAVPMLRFSRCSVILSSGSKDHFVKILACNSSRYCICSPYYCYACNLNILVTRIEVLVSSSQNRGRTGCINPEV